MRVKLSIENDDGIATYVEVYPIRFTHDPIRDIIHSLEYVVESMLKNMSEDLLRP